MTDKEDIFLHSKPVKILVQLNNPSKDNYASEIAREVDCTYSHTVRIIQKLEDHGFLGSEKKGRKKMIELTSYGEEVAEALSELLHKLRK